MMLVGHPPLGQGWNSLLTLLAPSEHFHCLGSSGVTRRVCIVFIRIVFRVFCSLQKPKETASDCGQSVGLSFACLKNMFWGGKNPQMNMLHNWILGIK